ncbi:hypothetical protein F53441_10907 [Fusarium austroafricanum]|uniref:Uncharacterized protein n=1 Tax=Fusarium austroafricanum TaxID=2364996 RepID=A0A8H4K9H7_9HYPO|nr:hypothetical protein F53441_10907 [Fusarium austroafricanum]
MFSSKSFQGSFAKLLASLFFLLAAAQLCIAAPYSTQLSVRDDHHLYARKSTPELEEYKRKLEASTRVQQDSTQFMDFTPAQNHMIASDGFQGCFGVILATKQGAVVGHYNQDKEHFEQAKKEIGDYYRDHNDVLGGAATFVYAAYNHREQHIIEQDLLDKYKDFLRELTGNEPKEHTYTEAIETLTDEELDTIGWDEDAIAGGFVIENSGGGSADSSIYFITIETQRDSALPARRL